MRLPLSAVAQSAARHNTQGMCQCCMRSAAQTVLLAGRASRARVTGGAGVGWERDSNGWPHATSLQACSPKASARLPGSTQHTTHPPPPPDPQHSDKHYPHQFPAHPTTPPSTRAPSGPRTDSGLQRANTTDAKSGKGTCQIGPNVRGLWRTAPAVAGGVLCRVGAPYIEPQPR